MAVRIPTFAKKNNENYHPGPKFYNRFGHPNPSRYRPSIWLLRVKGDPLEVVLFASAARCGVRVSIIGKFLAAGELILWARVLPMSMINHVCSMRANKKSIWKWRRPTSIKFYPTATTTILCMLGCFKSSKACFVDSRSEWPEFCESKVPKVRSKLPIHTTS